MPRSCRISTAVRTAIVGGIAGLMMCAFVFVPSAFAASTPPVDLGQAASYAVISGASVANTGLRRSAATLALPRCRRAFRRAVVDGTMQVGSADATASADMLTAYGEAQSRTGGTTLPALPWAALTPGLYTSAAAVAIPALGVVTLDGGGNPNAVFVIQVNGRCRSEPERRSN